MQLLVACLKNKVKHFKAEEEAEYFVLSSPVCRLTLVCVPLSRGKKWILAHLFLFFAHSL